MLQANNEIQEIADQFSSEYKSVVLATNTIDDEPYTSYAPFVRWDGKFYLLISKIAKHYANLQNKGYASILMIEDESSAHNIFFRKRLSYLVKVKLDVKNQDVQDAFISKFGKFTEQLFAMDFILVECHIQKGNIIVGPGQAYELDEKEQIISQMTGNTSSGHGSK